MGYIIDARGKRHRLVAKAERGQGLHTACLYLWKAPEDNTFSVVKYDPQAYVEHATFGQLSRSQAFELFRRTKKTERMDKEIR